ncbi:MAG: phage holin family protein [Verrucomicrobiota bacterium]
MEDETFKPGLFGRTKRLAGNFVEAIQTRLELFALEYREERTRLVILIVMALTAFLLFSLGVIVFTFAIAFAFEESYRVLAMCIMGALYFLLAVIVAFCLKSYLEKHGSAFDQTVEQLKKDAQCLKS